MEKGQRPDTPEEESETSNSLFTLLIVGFAMVVVGVALVAAAAALPQGSSAGFGGIIFIGPIPIVFGAGPGAPWLILIAVVLAALSLVTFLTLRRKPRNTGD